MSQHQRLQARWTELVHGRRISITRRKHQKRNHNVAERVQIRLQQRHQEDAGPAIQARSTATRFLQTLKTFRCRKIGHFTAIVTGRSTKLGCAASAFKRGKSRYTLIVCNYAQANLSGWSTYTAGPTASACITGSDSVYPGLCTVNEPIDPNKA